MAYIDKPFDKKTLHARSRLVMPPMATHMEDADGNVTKEILGYYDEKSKNDDLGLVIVEYAYISQQGKAVPKQLSVADDGKIAGLSKLAETIHANGCSAVMQIVHAGGATTSTVTGQTTVSPSGIPFCQREGGDRPITEEEIQAVVQDFADAAERVKEAGFDGVEIHSAHGYLLNQFYSSFTNRRTDAYGGSLENRLRIHRMVIDAVRERVGDAYAVLLRLGACDELDGGSTLSDAVEAAKILAGTPIDILDISGGLTGYILPGREEEQGYFSDVTKAIKAAVSLPVILTGGITDIFAADRLIQGGAADLIGVGRAILNDSDWVEKSFRALRDR